MFFLNTGTKLLQQWRADGEGRMEKLEAKLAMNMPFFVAFQESFEGIGGGLEALWRFAQYSTVLLQSLMVDIEGEMEAGNSQILQL